VWEEQVNRNVFRKSSITALLCCLCIFSLWLEECEGKIPQEQKNNKKIYVYIYIYIHIYIYIYVSLKVLLCSEVKTLFFYFGVIISA
jgi:dolichyl-phosphate-mannose--protein O-mannosyl transferase